MADEKTLMNERLPAPPTSTRGTPRERAVRRLGVLVKRASTAGAAVNLAACIGYGVVDPLPEPSFCMDVDPSRWANATAARLPDGTVRVVLFAAGDDGATSLSGPVGVVGGELVSTEPDGPAGVDAVTVIVRPNGDAAFDVVFAASCDGQPATLEANVSPADLPDGGEGDVPVSIR